MKDLEHRLTRLEKPTEFRMQRIRYRFSKERFQPVMHDIEKRLISLESRPVESTVSNVSFAEEPAPASMTTLIERVQVLEAKVNNMEPSLSNLTVINFVNTIRST